MFCTSGNHLGTGEGGVNVGGVANGGGAARAGFLGTSSCLLPWYVYMCVCVCMLVYVFVYVSLYVYVYVCICIFGFVFVFVLRLVGCAGCVCVDMCTPTLYWVCEVTAGRKDQLTF